MWFVLCVSVVWLYDSVSTNLVLVLLATAAYVSTVLVLPKVVLTVPLHPPFTNNRTNKVSETLSCQHSSSQQGELI